MRTRHRLSGIVLAGATLTCVHPAAASAFITPMGNIATQRAISYFSSGTYFWKAPYDVSFLNEALWAALSTEVSGIHPRKETREEPDEWKDGIEEAWRNRFFVPDEALWYPREFQVAWVTSYADESDFVRTGSGGGNGTIDLLTQPAATMAALADLDSTPLHYYAGLFRRPEEARGRALGTIALDPAVDFLFAAVLVGVGVAGPWNKKRRRRRQWRKARVSPFGR